MKQTMNEELNKKIFCVLKSSFKCTLKGFKI